MDVAVVAGAPLIEPDPSRPLPTDRLGLWLRVSYLTAPPGALIHGSSSSSTCRPCGFGLGGVFTEGGWAFQFFGAPSPLGPGIGQPKVGADWGPPRLGPSTCASSELALERSAPLARVSSSSGLTAGGWDPTSF